MVKFGKEYRKYQVKQWKDSYLDYKALKQKIKEIVNNINDQKPPSRSTEPIENNDIGHPSIQPMDLVPEDSIIIEVQDLHSLYNLRYGNELKNFIDLLEKEFRKCYIHFVNQEKELYKKVNGHCYSSQIYKDYNVINIFNEIKEIGFTMKLAKQLNCFINDNVMALKKILKKFDKKFQRYFGIIAPKYILTHLTSQNSDLEYLLQFKLIDEATTICDNNLKILLNLYKKLRGNNININNKNEENKINDSSQEENNNNVNNIKKNHKPIDLNIIDNHINTLKNKIYEYLDSIDELTYFKIQYREWFYYARLNERLVKNNPKIFENDIYNPILSSTYHKDSLLEKCISSKNALKEVERSQSPLSHSNRTNLAIIYIQAAIYGTMITNIFPVISNYFKLYISSDLSTLFLVPIFATYLSQILPFKIFVYLDSYMKMTYIVSYFFLFISSLILIFVKNEKNHEKKNFFLILLSRALIGFANNQMMNKKYITLYLPKFRLPRASKNYLISELIGLVCGPFITFILCNIKEYNTKQIHYTNFNCIGWYGIFISFLAGVIHIFFFIQPLSNEFIMVKDESNISGNKYYQRSESEISRKQYLKEQNSMYKKTYKTMKKKNKKKNRNNNEKKGNKDDINNLIIKNVVNKNNDDKEKEKMDENNIINTNNDLEEKLIDNNNEENDEDNENKNNISIDSNNEANTSLDVSTGGNIALTTKQKNMINELDKVLEKRNEECNFDDMNKIPKTIDLIIKNEKKTFGYINQNILLLFIIFFVSSMIKSNLILNYIYYFQEKFDSDYNYNVKQFCLLIFLLFVFQILTIFFIFPFYQVNYKFKIFMLFTVTGLVLFNLPLIINIVYDSKYLFVIINILLLLGCSIIDICCSCYLSFILAPEWIILGKKVGHWSNYIILSGKICGGLICMLLSPKNHINHWVLVGITFAFFICVLFLLFFTRILKIKGITRVIRKSVLEIEV